MGRKEKRFQENPYMSFSPMKLGLTHAYHIDKLMFFCWPQSVGRHVVLIRVAMEGSDIVKEGEGGLSGSGRYSLIHKLVHNFIHKDMTEAY